MGNTLKFIDMVARESLAVAHEKVSFIGTVDRQYDDSYAQSGAKIGSTLRVKNPNKYTRRQGSRVMDIQDQNESTQNLTLATQDGVDMRFNSAELTLDTDNPKEVAAFSKRYIEPAVSVLLSGIEADFLAYATKRVYNVIGGPVAGGEVTVTPTVLQMGLGRARLNQMLAPKDGRCVQMDSVNMATLVNSAAAYFNPGADIGKQYREGLISRTQMADFYENERLHTLTNINDVTANTNADALVTDGGANIALSEDLASPTVGSVFTVAGVYACHPETKANLGYLQQFTVLTTGASASSVTVSPSTYLTGANKNVCSSTGADLAVTDFNEKATVWVGEASNSYIQPIMYHPDAFQFVTADLPLMDDAHKCARRTQEGLSIRVWQASDIRNDEMLMRLDILYGFGALRPEWATRFVFKND